MNFGELLNNIYRDLPNILSPYLVAAFLGYFIAQLGKIVTYLIKYKEFNWREFFRSGGMPSSHSATVMALATTISVKQGFGSPIFAIALIFAVIVIYDATHVRRATGEQGIVINELISNDNKAKIKKPYFSRGHKPLEAIVGSILGVIIGIVIVIIYNV